MTKHTPGPWRARPADKHQGPKFWVNAAEGGPNQPHGRLVATVGAGTGDVLIVEANAHLIAAAPDLLEALRWLTHTSCDVGKSGDPPTQAEHDDAIRAGMAAIKKAEGD